MQVNLSLTAVFAPLAPQNWGGQEPKFPNMGEFRERAKFKFIDAINSLKDCCKYIAPSYPLIHSFRDHSRKRGAKNLVPPKIGGLRGQNAAL
jgi:hypothetical protein